ELRYLHGTGRSIYEEWTEKNSLKPKIEKLLDDNRASLFWIGERRKGKDANVILCFHGDGFMYPTQAPTLSFWYSVQAHLQRKGKSIGIVFLDYSLIPGAAFPTQLSQAVLAIKHLLNLGMVPENIHLAGSSAGGNLVLQVLSHMLHPLPEVPELPLGRLGSVYLLSPWVILYPPSSSTRKRNESTDVLDVQTLNRWGRQVLTSVASPTQPDVLPYLEPSKAPPAWFTGLGKLVNRLLITAGGGECLVDEIAEFATRLQKERIQIRYFHQPGGVYNDPYMDFIISTDPKKWVKVGNVVKGWYDSGLE
ncbi:Alpha/Beta hydrolase protein, partial [Crucibulum laeve]